MVFVWLVSSPAQAKDVHTTARYTALATEINAPAVEKMQQIDWNKWDYSMVLVLGKSPANASERLHSRAIQRMARGVELLQQGNAPLIAVSGGNVYPRGTTINEARSMQQHLVATHGIAADKILVEPYAQHTTTNLRNIARLAVAYGIPLDKPILVTTDLRHMAMIRSILGLRNRWTLGYLPYRELTAVSLTEFVIWPDRASLQPGNDPLDP